jgi:hypothetical protein
MATEETNGTVQSPADLDPKNGPRVDRYFVRNHDPQDLIRYQGNWVAWSLDGRKILFASPDGYQLCEMIDRAGLKPGDYVLGGIPPEGYFPEPGLEVLD